MGRSEFLSILRESLEGCVPMAEVESNLVFYRNYFEESGRPDKEVIEELGDPRLIARTIIDAYKASKGPMADYYTEQARSEYSHEHSGQYDDAGDPGRNGGYSGGEMRWYERAFSWLVIFIVLAVILVVAVAVVGVFVGYVLPVILLVVIIKVLADYFRK